MNMKKLIAGAVALGPTLALLAEDTSTYVASTTQLGAVFTNAQTNMTALVTAAMPVISAFVGGGLIIWGAIALLSVIKRAFLAGKGR